MKNAHDERAPRPFSPPAPTPDAKPEENRAPRPISSPHLLRNHVEAIDESLLRGGTLPYLSPTAIAGMEAGTFTLSVEVDKYAVGLVMLQLIAGSALPATLVSVRQCRLLWFFTLNTWTSNVKCGLDVLRLGHESCNIHTATVRRYRNNFC